MFQVTLGIIGGGQLGSMLAIAANKLKIKTVIFCDDIDAPAQNFCNEFVFGQYNDQYKINDFITKAFNETASGRYLSPKGNFFDTPKVSQKSSESSTVRMGSNIS